MFWGRVKRRPTTHVGLAVGAKLSESKCYRIFKSNFFNSCFQTLPSFQALPGARATDAFTHADGNRVLQEFISNLCQTFVKVSQELGSASAQVCQIGTPLSSLTSRSKSFKQRIKSTIQVQSSTLENVGWIGLCLPSGHHVTLLGPRKSLMMLANAEVLLREWRAVTRYLWSNSQRTFKVEYRNQYTAYPRTIPAGSKPENYQICFWEVTAIRGLSEQGRFSVQAPYYHITDEAKLGVKMKAKMAYDVLKEAKGKCPEDSRKFRTIVSVLEAPRREIGTISFFK